jgi:hypothetical protein
LWTQAARRVDRSQSLAREFAIDLRALRWTDWRSDLTILG